ncbi:MAG: sugar ABC transporter permease [Spirochaetales bacterium]|nr:MAG: sugar ABC transporter permease [Spirochaetales bacterium]
MSVQRVLVTLGALAAVPLFLIFYILFTESALARGKGLSTSKVRPWIWLLPAMALLCIFLIYPTINTIILSVMNANSTAFAGLKNFAYIFTDNSMLIVLRNNLLWVVFFTLITVTLGLLFAVLTDRVKYEAAAKALIFLPMAISFVAAGVIWKFMYEYKPAGTTQIGTVNAVLTGIFPGFQPQAWLFNKSQNNWALIIVGIWMWTGFSMVILSASLKGISPELLEAARIDGAGEFAIFFRIILPLMKNTIAVVTTTMVINVLKIFDIVYVMTNGNLDTEVIANRMYKEMFNYRQYGRASALAMILLVAIVPIMLLNIKRFRREG